MTIDDQLRAIARHADEHQAPITFDEIIGRASRHDLTTIEEQENAVADGRRVSRLLLAVAAAIVVLAGAVGLLALDGDESPGTLRTVTDPPKPSVVVRNGLIAFAADPRAGDALTDPLDHRSAEVDPAPRDLFMTREGGPVRRLTSTAANERCPTFSPDGERLAYLELPGVDRSGDASIVAVALDEQGTPAAPEARVALPASTERSPYGLRTTIGPVSCPSWSPDSTSLAYYANVVPDGSDPPENEVVELRVWTLRGQDRVLARTTPHHFYRAFGWSPDGRALAYTAPGGAWVARLDGSAPSLVLGVDETPIHPDFAGPPRQEATAVSWSSRGELAVTVTTTTFKDGQRSNDGSLTWTSDEQTSVHIVDLATGADRILDEPVATDSRVVWSPDGSRFVTTGVDGTIRVVGRDGAPAVALAPRDVDGIEVPVPEVSWSPDGERLLSRIATERGAALVSLSVDGAAADVLTPWTWAFDLITLDDVSWQPVTADQ